MAKPIVLMVGAFLFSAGVTYVYIHSRPAPQAHPTFNPNTATATATASDLPAPKTGVPALVAAYKPAEGRTAEMQTFDKAILFLSAMQESDGHWSAEKSGAAKEFANVNGDIAITSVCTAALIDASGKMRHQAADPAARLAVPPQLERGFEDLPRLTGRGLDPVPVARIKNLAVSSEQGGLVVEQIHLARTAVHEQLDHPFGARTVMAAVQQKRTVSGRVVGFRGQTFLTQQPAERGPAESAAELPEKIATGSGELARKGGLHGAS